MENNPCFTVLNKRIQFENLKKFGKRVYPNHWMIVNYQTNDLGHVRCGWTISKKVGKAVTRNKFKRWLREIFKELVKEKKSIDVNVVLRAKENKFYETCTFKQFENDLKKAWRKIPKHS